ncbi:MAG TPA: 16S rRNA (guanine(527)-N(7))-methyltransferase RsmG [Candidatus Syntrophosphaera sp.]|jgi:16S rRNA (guanine527-N7)-methyltransferase|nr:MAG: Ribosomal RNA small subunit methyltransferase G [Candidatus Cloacimonetes bacterium ADurb.Bin211]HOD59628.1 16S rRNA (guanine(527)-N(7))-methyltransferase RsmG [Candidatus Syntrophosphaera sp.]HQM79150.1 16S rRNA (guanine(527)-N(7))-methyltransferase RsmG [Candidatus Syntrophosphaera sp.]
MSNEREEFIYFLQELKLSDIDTIISRFELYYQLLIEYNQHINLFSRATPVSNLWTHHFLDSLLPLKVIDFSNKKLMDFGSGGGLPGIPVKLAIPSCKMVLLDSIHKRARATSEMIIKMELSDCESICSRLEDYYSDEKFDYILCRAVKMERRYYRHMKRLLKPEGLMLLYKAKDYNDIAALKPRELIREDFSYGKRVIYALKPSQF